MPTSTRYGMLFVMRWGNRLRSTSARSSNLVPFKIADLLEVSPDVLVGRKEPVEDAVKIRNPELHSLYREIDRLSDEDQQALVVLLDFLVKRSRFQKMMAG